MNYTFEGIKAYLKEKLSLLSEWRNILFFSVYERLFSSIAYILRRVVYYAERLYQESSWFNATQYDSILPRCEFLSYFPHRKIGASNYVRVSADETFDQSYKYGGESVILDKWTKITNESGSISSYTTEEITYYAGNETVKTFLTGGESASEDGVYVSIPVNSTIGLVVGDTLKIDGTQNYDGYFTIQEIGVGYINIDSSYTSETFTGSEYLVSGITLIPVKEGDPKEFIYTANGELNESFKIYSENIEEEVIDVYIVDADNNILATVTKCRYDIEQTKLYFINDPDNYYCEVETSRDFKSVEFTFGDDIYAKRLQNGERILVKYADTNGSEGNIEAIDTLTVFAETLYDAEENEITLYVTNEEPISDGQDIESLESIKNNAPVLFNTGYRCGGYKDWIDILEDHPQIYKAIIWSTDDIADDTITTNQNKVYMTAISSEGEELTSSQQNNITQTYLKEKKSPTELVVWQPLKVLFLRFVGKFKVQDRSFEVIRSQINQTLINNYGILNTDFKINVYDSNFTATIDNLDTIVRHDTEIYHVEKDFLYNTQEYELMVSYTANDTTDKEEQIFLVPQTLKLWLQLLNSGVLQSPVEIGEDISGVIEGKNGYTIIDEDIDYTLNEISFNVTNLSATDPDDYTLSISYKTQDGNGDLQNDVRLPSFDIITNVDAEFNDFDDMEYV